MIQYKLGGWGEQGEREREWIDDGWFKVCTVDRRHSVNSVDKTEMLRVGDSVSCKFETGDGIMTFKSYTCNLIN